VKRYLSLALLSLVACGKDSAPARQGPPPTPEVGVVTVEVRPVTLTRELPGRVSAFRVAEVHARVNGIVQRRLFTEGSDVKAGQALFKIDPDPYQATLESARAQLMRAEATVESAKAQAERFTKLVETNAVSRQEYEDAVARLKTANADVAAARAQVKSARIDVDFTTVQAPIAGRIGRSEVTEGAYVQAQQATLLATIQQLDRVYVDLTWSLPEVMRLRRAIESGAVQSEEGKARVTVIHEDGREHGEVGVMQFADVSVDQTTGSIALRAIVPNPRAELFPGMFVRARIEEGIKANAILVPQRAVTRDQNGRPTTLVVDGSGKVERRLLATDRAVGDAWLVTEGLAAGEQVIVEGMQMARPGATVKAVPASVPPATATTQHVQPAAAPSTSEPSVGGAGSSPPPPAPASGNGAGPSQPPRAGSGAGQPQPPRAQSGTGQAQPPRAGR
jgi:membrane fusion protein, multidrug efflux system